MNKPMAYEVQILRYFETGSIERAELLFTIVAEKMRERLQGRDQSNEESGQQDGAVRKRHARPSPEAPAGEPSAETS